MPVPSAVKIGLHLLKKKWVKKLIQKVSDLGRKPENRTDDPFPDFKHENLYDFQTQEKESKIILNYFMKI